jgi:membrane protein
VASPSGLIHRVQASRAWRAWQRYGKARGGVLAGGMAYVAFFSLLPALAVGFTVFGLVLGHNSSLQPRVIRAVNDGVGTTIITVPHGKAGIVDIATLTGSNQLTLAAIVGLVGFLLTGLGWLDAMREGIRAMFGQPTFEGNVVKTKLRDLVALATLGVVLLISAVGGVVVSGATGALLGWVGLSGSTLGSLLLGAASTLVLLGVDILVFLVIFRLLSGVQVPNADLWDASLFGGIGLGILKLLSGLLLSSAGSNKLLAAGVLVLSLLIWLNLVSRLTLVAAAWGATVAIDRGHLVVVGTGLPEAAEEVGRRSRPSIAGESAGREPIRAGRAAPGPRPAPVAGRPGGPAPAVPFTPTVSPRAADRISVVAGAVLGAAGLFAARTAAVAVRSAIDSARRSD